MYNKLDGGLFCTKRAQIDDPHMVLIMYWLEHWYEPHTRELQLCSTACRHATSRRLADQSVSANQPPPTYHLCLNSLVGNLLRTSATILYKEDEQQLSTRHRQHIKLSNNRRYSVRYARPCVLLWRM